MRFSQSERQLHQLKQYTPPCNYYELQTNKPPVLTGSLAGPSQTKEQPCFGLASRFNSIASRAPGPGAYVHDRQQQKLNPAVLNSIKLREYKKQAIFSMEDQPPSIPYQQFKHEEEDLQSIKQLLISEDLNKSALFTKRKAEGYTFPKSQRTQKKVQKEEKPLEVVVEYGQRPQQKHHISQMKERIKKANERRSEIIHQINTEFVPSLELIELITKRMTKYTPGPGEYNNDRDQPHKLKEHGQSFSASKRFTEAKDKVLGPGQYEPAQPKRQSISFSKSARTLFNLKAETDLQHRFYIDPYSNIEKRQKQSVKGQNQLHPFGSEAARNFQLKKEGPRISDTYKQKKQSKLKEIVEKRLKAYEKKKTMDSQGLLGLSTMASSIQ